MNNPPSRFIYSSILLIGILAVSTASIFIKFAQEDAPSLTIAAIRLTIACLILAPVALKNHTSEMSGIKRNEFFLVVLSGLFLAIHFATWISSLEYTSVASSVVFVSTGPLWVALLSPIFLNEKLSTSAFFGLSLTLVGGTVIAFSSACIWENGIKCPYPSDILHGRAMWGNFLALMGAWAVTGYLMIGRRLRGNISIIPYIFLVYSIAALLLLIIMFAAGESPFGYQPMTYIWLALLALLPQLVGHSIYNWSLRFFPAAIVAVSTLGEPIGSAILAYFILKEKPGLFILFGGIMILIGIYIATRRKVGNPNTALTGDDNSISSLP